MMTQGDPLYDVKFAEVVSSEAPVTVASQPSALQRPATPAKRPTPAAPPTATPAAKRPKLSKPEPAADDGDLVASEPGMSGDDNE